MPDENKCAICEEAITNPICPACLGKQVTYWAEERSPGISAALDQIGKSLGNSEGEDASCIICKDGMCVCPHCYCSEIYSWLRENRYSRLSKRFLKHFNYELDYRFDLKAARVGKAA